MSSRGVVLVTGGSGLVGARLLHVLTEQGWRCRCLVHQHPVTGADDQVIGDLVDPSSLPAAVRGATAVVHLAAVTHSRSPARYEAVSSGRTAHAEAVHITYDPRVISYGQILQIFFSVAHDPTQLNRQGPDVGPQYRSAIFYQNDKQKQVAEAYVAQMNTARAHGRPVVTQLNKFDAFYPAEPYHQDYAFLHPNNPYIAANDLPKVENLKKIFADVFRDKPNLVAAASN